MTKCRIREPNLLPGNWYTYPSHFPASERGRAKRHHTVGDGALVHRCVPPRGPKFETGKGSKTSKHPPIPHPKIKKILNQFSLSFRSYVFGSSFAVKFVRSSFVPGRTRFFKTVHWLCRRTQPLFLRGGPDDPSAQYNPIMSGHDWVLKDPKPVRPRAFLATLDTAPVLFP